MNTAVDLLFCVFFSDHPLAKKHEENLHVFLAKAAGVTASAGQSPTASV